MTDNGPRNGQRTASNTNRWRAAGGHPAPPCPPVRPPERPPYDFGASIFVAAIHFLPSFSVTVPVATAGFSPWQVWP